MKLIKPAAIAKQGNLTLLTTTLKVSDLLIDNFYSIERLDPENANEKGYQRLLNKGRAKKLADYILAGQDSKDVFLPTSVFMATDKNIDFDNQNNTITIDTDLICPFSIVDGQHRVEGLRMAAEQDSRVKEFEIPVNIAINLDEISQMCHFLIVNTTQKSVDESIAQRIRARLTDLIDTEDTPKLPKWIDRLVQRGEDAKALAFVDYLNSIEASPWKNKIKMANGDSKEGVVNQQSFVKQIKKYVITFDNPIFSEEVQKQHKIFLNYWIAISNIIQDPEATILYKYNGVVLFCKFFTPFMQKMVNMSDYKVQTMTNILSSVFDSSEGEATGVGHVDFWKKGGKASGLNESALSKICSEMIKALHSTGGTSISKEV